MPAYPSTFPFFDSLSSVSETGPQDNVIRSQMDTGPSKTRRRSTAAVRLFSGSTTPMTEAQLALFEAWFSDVIADGALSFTATHPRLNVIKTFKFIGSYDITTLRTVVKEYAVSASLEVLP